ncbi:discoidin domain-containing protein [Flavobacterium sp. MAH-1]|uniref:Discoidin domain-containing protein n=1 Tax=Flavobacterium agri TaxID=2743471 RepID=A0A7Y9C3U3_9FLAO|nr:discoidin domain-containing protein [Flavobacterium agri]NUY79441.1 discoidin domain-containing protein [Flavobacterium agri]NYA69466.1 discoidin domain-containing protein [Flavobacterium agri]
MIKKSILAAVFCLPMAAISQQQTFCNPVNIDYGYTPHESFTEWGKHRATADPVIVNYKNDLYLFSTNQWGYWHSDDMLHWKFHPKRFLRPWNDTKDELCAPGVGVVGDTMVVFGSTYTKTFSLWGSTDPKNDKWFVIKDSLAIGGWDPGFFTDTDGKFYMYNGSSNRHPVFGVELDRKTFEPIGSRRPMYFLEDWRYGWQRFGENMDNTFLDPFIEGAHMTKHNGKYYFQYGAPGTEFSGYADGVVVGQTPLFDLEPNVVPQSDPLSFKPGGFNRGAGHGATFEDKFGQYWHVSTTVVCVKNTWERRIGIWPTGFDKDDVMWCNTAFGDYPQFLPEARKNGKTFPGWMLLNYKKPVTVSSTLGSFFANNANDENIKTYWSAKTANKGEWIATDLGQKSTVNAIQLNYADQDAEFVGKQTGIYHQYKIYSSDDGKNWKLLVDKSDNKTDVPHDYIELEKPIRTRFIKLENIHMPTGKFAISGLRVFGNGNGAKPDKVGRFFVLRTEKDKRSAYLKWTPVDNAFAYNIYYGTEPDKLYNCIMVHDFNEYWLKVMDLKKTYYFTIEAINENGVSAKSELIKAE